jgi:hypothetical protein
MKDSTKILFIAACLVIYMCMAGPGSANAQKSISPELIGQLTQQLSITPKQAAGGAGALFGLAKSKLSADQFGQVANAVPGMDGLLKSAPKVKQSATSSTMNSITGALPGGLGGLTSLAGSFKSLGLSPDMITKMAPMLEQFVTAKGGAGVGGLLSGIF